MLERVGRNVLLTDAGMSWSPMPTSFSNRWSARTSSHHPPTMRAGLLLPLPERSDDGGEALGVADDVVADADVCTQAFDLVDDLFD